MMTALGMPAMTPARAGNGGPPLQALAMSALSGLGKMSCWTGFTGFGRIFSLLILLILSIVRSVCRDQQYQESGR